MIVLIPEFVGKVSCLATHRRFPPSPLHKAACCIWVTVRGSSHPGQVMAVLESLGWGVFALLLLALLGRSGLSSVLTVWSRPLVTLWRIACRGGGRGCDRGSRVKQHPANTVNLSFPERSSFHIEIPITASSLFVSV